VGASPTAALNPPMLLTNDILTIRKSMSGAVAKALADSAVPWPLSSVAAFEVAGPSSAVWNL
jgi:hypothetical protein